MQSIAIKKKTYFIPDKKFGENIVWRIHLIEKKANRDITRHAVKSKAMRSPNFDGDFLQPR